LAALLMGTLLFSGSVTAARLLGWSSAAAPLGGMLMMAAWLAWAVDAARR
ncbi:membrane protein, partial [Lysobacter defluvii IMMIB APB-9 = DSM 18482]